MREMCSGSEVPICPFPMVDRRSAGARWRALLREWCPPRLAKSFFASQAQGHVELGMKGLGVEKIPALPVGKREAHTTLPRRAGEHTCADLGTPCWHQESLLF